MINLEQILKDAEEFEKVRDGATPGEWRQGYYPKEDYVYLDDEPLIQCENGRLDATFIAAAKNFDSAAIIKQLVSRIRELENER